MAALAMQHGAIVADRAGIIRNAEPVIWQRNYEAQLAERVSPVILDLMFGAAKTRTIARVVSLVGWGDAHRALTRDEALLAGTLRNLIIA
jgi:hypothetical protein